MAAFCKSAKPPLVFVRLSASTEGSDEFELPDCPAIGVGAATHPLAARLDSHVEGPVQADGLLRAVSANPLAASGLVRLLRQIDGMGLQDALVAESLAYGELQAGSEHADWLAAQAGGPDTGAPGTVEVVRDADRLSVTMHRAHANNAVDVAMRDGLREAFELAALDPEIRRVDFRGEGKAFCVGADLTEFGTTREPARAHEIRMQTLPAHALARCADKVTARIQGACIGAGLEMAAFAHRIEATPNAVFQLPELKMGLIPGAGGCVSVSRRIGRHRCALMVLSGRRFSAKTALEWGLVDVLVDPCVD